MISKTLLKQSIKSNYKIILIFIAVLTLYFSIIANMYDPNDLGILDQLASLKLSPELLSAMGFTLTDTSLLGFLSSYFYGLLMVAFPIICYSILANKLVAAQVDKGSMAYLLSTPNTRDKVVATQAVFLLGTITAMVAFVTILGIVFCQIQFPGLLDIGGFIMVNLGVLSLHFALSGICFFASCLFNESKNSILLGAGLPIAFLLIQMISNSGESLNWLKYFTLNTMFNPLDIMHGNGAVSSMFILLGTAALLYGTASIFFNKKDLPI